MAATQAVSEVRPEQIVWQGVIEPDVLDRILDLPPEQRPTRDLMRFEQVFQAALRPVIVAAYFYETTPGGQRHGRFLLLDLGGGVDAQTDAPFVYSLDLALGWLGTHEYYGAEDELRYGLEAQFAAPLAPNRLQFALFSRDVCGAGADAFTRQQCDRMATEGIRLPVDAQAAEAFVQTQWDTARALTASAFPDLSTLAQWATRRGPGWWDDPAVSRFSFPTIRVCSPEGDCATFASIEMTIDRMSTMPLVP